MSQKITLFWHRRDLRIHDNAGLYNALKSSNPVLPIFIFDKNILDKLENKSDQRVDFIHQSIQGISDKLSGLGSSILVKYGFPFEILKELTQQYQIAEVHTNHDYEKYGIQRDAEIKAFLNENGIAFYTHKDQTIFEKDEVLSNAGTPYTVFTPYSRKWKEKAQNPYYFEAYPNEEYAANYLKTSAFEIPSLASMGFEKTNAVFPKNEVSDLIIQQYGEKRDFPAIIGTSRLSVHLRFGTISIRDLAKKGTALGEKWLNELIWRDFYMNIIHHFPHVMDGKAFRKEYDAIEWRKDENDFKRWCEGNTGYPIVDAGMRELNATGFMHNRVRMVVASFLTKHLLLDWRWGEAYFAQKLMDFDFSANNGGWQWASGSGCDAAPYFRVFNPTSQTEKFDKQLQYIKKWVPEISSFNYPRPMVEHSFARERALRVYKEGLERGKMQ
jgi:deoxyribodipyrimidine photo-lyase